jgi:aminopeptidase N
MINFFSSAKLISLVFFLFFISFDCQCQLFDKDQLPTKADTLRGTLSAARSCYDVNFYHLDIRVDTAARSINGYNNILFTVTENTFLLQLDLFENMTIRNILLDDSVTVKFRREFNAVFIDFNTALVKGSQHSLTVYYGGQPVQGKLLPWNGGFKWTHDMDGNPWIVVACQGTGASLWWPNKDHQSDEPDSMLISVSVPSSLTEISNGRLRSKKELRGGYTRYEWFVSVPVNNYDVTLNIGNYSHFNDTYFNDNGDSLTLDYYVLPYNLIKAMKQFQEVKPILKCYEKFFGNYPFYADGYKLVETPYLGMEHQSCIAYGNDYETGYHGTDYSGIGLDFDYILVHETAHEWWGNSVTTKDIADMWVHEGFASYAEMLYTLCTNDSATAVAYANSQKRKVSNKKAVTGPYGVNKEGSGDMYSKGMLMLYTLSHIINNDSLWFSILKGIQKDFKYKTVTAKDIESYIESHAKMDLKLFFDQYLQQANLPTLEIHQKSNSFPIVAEYRWSQCVPGFNMPLLINAGNQKPFFIYPEEKWKSIELTGEIKDAFAITQKLFYFNLQIE